MKGLKKRLKKLATMGLTAVLLMGSMPLSQFTVTVKANVPEPTVISSNTTSWSGEMVVNSDVTIDGDVELTGDTVLTIAEGKKLSVNGAISSDYDENNQFNNLTINGSGELNVTNNGTCMYVGRLIFDEAKVSVKNTSYDSNTIESYEGHVGNGGCDGIEIRSGSIIVEGGSAGIFPWFNDINISGGSLTTKSEGDGIDGCGNLSITGGTVDITAGDNGYGVYCDQDKNISITGGRVKISGGAAGVSQDTFDYDTELTLGMMDPEDYVEISGFDFCNPGGYKSYVKLADGVKLTDGSNLYTGPRTLTDDEVTAIAGKRLAPFVPMTFTSLQQTLDNASTDEDDPTRIKLFNDVTVSGNEAGLVVKTGTYVELDLNGHTLDRGLYDPALSDEENRKEGKDPGCAIEISPDAGLTLKDSSDDAGTPEYDGTGRIIGGNAYNSGGGVDVRPNAVFTMVGGRIEDNFASNYGGGVYLDLYSSFTLNGGVIDGNRAVEGAGVFVERSAEFTMNGGRITGNCSILSSTGRTGKGSGIHSGGTFTMTGGVIEGNNVMPGSKSGGGVLTAEPAGTIRLSGSAVIRDNVFGGTKDETTGLYTGGKADNLHFVYYKFAPSNVPVIAGPLTDEASIGITSESTATAEAPFVITEGLAGNGTIEHFISDDPAYDVILKDGEAALVPHVHTCTYSVSAAAGNVITAVCSKAGCEQPGNKVSLTIKAPTMTVSGDKGSAKATLEGLDAFNAATSLALSDADIRYAGRGNTVYAKSAVAPTGAGTYTASISAGGVTASVNYSINEADIDKEPGKGDVITDAKSKAEVKITNDSAKNGTAEYVGPSNAGGKSQTVPDTVTVGGKTFSVTTVSADAFKGSKATTVTLGKNIKKLSPKAFNGSKVKTIIIKSKKLTKKSVKNALKGSKAKKVTIKVKVGKKKENQKYVKKYKKYFTKKNAGMKVTVK